MPARADEPGPDRACEVAAGSRGALCCDSAAAADVGRRVLDGGGNAVDAAIAVAAAMAVTWPEAGNIGGGGFMVIAPPGDADVACVDYRETAPSGATVDSFRDWTLRRHARMAGVPGTVRGLAEAHRRYGSRPWHELLAPAVRLAADGFAVDTPLADSLNGVLSLSSIRSEPRHAEFRRTFAHPDGRAWRAGDRLVQPDLAATLRQIAADPDAFYTGPIAGQIVAEMRREGGLIEPPDLAGYRAIVRRPTQGRFGDYTFFGPPPPSSGGPTVLMQLQTVDALGIRSHDGRWTADTAHLLCEVMRRSFRERAASLGDPDYVPNPAAPFTPDAARRLAAAIDRERATPSDAIAGDIPLTPPAAESSETTHFSIVDRHGMAVSNTYTLEASWGSCVVVRGAGFVLNNEMGDFNWVPGETTRTGRIGTPPNLVAPGKRMLSSQSPVIVKLDGRVRLIVGSPGGRTIINTVSQVIIRHLLWGQPLDAAVAAPRMHHQWFPDVLFLEGTEAEFAVGLADDLRERGHTVQYRGDQTQGSVHAIAIDADGRAAAVADWRRGGAARAVTGK